jgi:O-succinylhomoserine sulfhydrylase
MIKKNTLISSLHPQTQAIRAGSTRSQFGEHSDAVMLTSSFVFSDAQEAAFRFQNPNTGPVYGRFTNPTTRTFESRLALLEQGEDCLATASGMSAIFTLCLGLLNAGDHIVAANNLFGSTVQLFTQVLPRFNIQTTFVDPTDLSAWKKATLPQTKIWFVESPSNPLTVLTDIQSLAKAKTTCQDTPPLLVIDNCFCTPILQKPLSLGADVVIHSATKFLDGQGRVLGGAIVGSQQLIQEKLLPILRVTGPTLSAFNAWVILKGLETLNLRMEQHSVNAFELAKWLEKQPNVQRVYYPWLESHPQYHLAKQQQLSGGPIVSFEVKAATPEEARQKAWHVIDSCQLLSITANLGDTKTTITHPATTTHGRLSPQERERAGITENLIRLSVGLEHVDDLIHDLSVLSHSEKD